MAALFSSSLLIPFSRKNNFFTYKRWLICMYQKQISEFSTNTRASFSTLTAKDIDFFRTFLEPSSIIMQPDDLLLYNIDWLKSHTGKSPLVLRPKNTEQVSQILAYCNDKNLAVCPQGGNTGLVGGSIPIFDEIVISMSLMNQILDFDDNSGTLQCQAGCVLESLENFVNGKNYTVPVDLGAKGSCQIGGNLSTNAGGLRFLRYGSLHGNVLGLKAVLANGKIIDCMNTMRKNNTGYDLKHLFIGSEGTLGIITEAAILCYPKSPETSIAFLVNRRFSNTISCIFAMISGVDAAFGHPSEGSPSRLVRPLLNKLAHLQTIVFEEADSPNTFTISVYFIGLNSFEQCLNTAKVIRQKLPEVLSSLEMLDDAAADTLKDNLKISPPISKHPFYILVEISGSNQQHNEEKLNDCLTYLMEKNHVSDGTVATEPSRIKAVWEVRERITEALLLEGYGYKYDISLPLDEFYKIVEIMRERLGQKVTRCVAYGHLGDGNLHFNATSRKFDSSVLSLIEPFIYEWTSERKGSISAEHGIGFKKSKYLHFNKTANAISLMKSMKQMMDPKGILNPYKVLPN